MSFSNPTAKNPATRFMQWRGGEDGGGRVIWYDKATKQENEVTLPFSFIVLDELTTLTGFNDNIKQSYWSNEVRNSNDTLVVRNKNGIQAKGTYQDIKAHALSGLKYTQSVYIAFKDESGELVIGNLKLAGAAFSAWLDFKKQYDIEQCAVYITDEPKKAKKGATTYYKPVFEGQNISDNTRKQVVALDEELQKYLNTYLQRKPDETDNGATVVDDEPEDDIHNVAGLDSPAPTKATPTKVPKAEDVVIEDLDKKAAEKPAEPAKATAPKAGALKDVEF